MFRVSTVQGVITSFFENDFQVCVTWYFCIKTDGKSILDVNVERKKATSLEDSSR